MGASLSGAFCVVGEEEARPPPRRFSAQVVAFYLPKAVPFAVFALDEAFLGQVHGKALDSSLGFA